MYWLVIHELTHILGFQRELYDFWKRPDGSYLGIYNILHIEPVNGRLVNNMKTPKVV
jgi:hypothetical protein